jgi:hypothetical protein
MMHRRRFLQLPLAGIPLMLLGKAVGQKGRCAFDGKIRNVGHSLNVA